MAWLINFCKYFFNVIRCCRGEGNFELHPFFISFLSFKTHGLCCVDYLIIYLFIFWLFSYLFTKQSIRKNTKSNIPVGNSKNYS